MKYIVLLFSIFIFGASQAQFWDFTAPKRLEATVNSSSEESAPIFSPNGKELYFVRTFDESNVGGNNDQDIWYSFLNQAGKWEESENIVELNTKFNDGLLALRNGGNRAYIRYSNPKDKNEKGIAVVEREVEGKWKTPKKLTIPGFNVQGKHFGFCLSEDEKTIIISYQGEGTVGAEDLYFSTLTNGTWSQLKSLGRSVNSTGFEISPFLNPTADTLFFASNGFGGEGNADIFYSVKGSGFDDWSSPKNMGNKINSPTFDAYPFKIGNRIYWSSNKNATDADIYYADVLFPPLLVANEKHKHVSIFQGTDGAIDVSVVSGVAPYTYRWSNGQITEDISNLKRGMYMVEIVDAIQQKTKLTIEITEPQPEKQKVIRLPEVRYALNSWTFVNDATIQSNDSLNRVAELLNEYPGMQLELLSHTDARGDNKKNQLLSENRAKAVYKYLVEEKGIDPRRLVPIGKGESSPATIFDEKTNQTILLSEQYINGFKTDKVEFERLHQFNRRTEGRIISMDFDPKTAPEAPKSYLQFVKIK